MPYPRVCEGCGNEFVPDYKDHTYCSSECAKGEPNMNTSKHTPGPWTVEETRDGMTIRDNRRRLEIVHNYPNGEGQQVIVGKHTGLDCLTEANAALIAAAPAMYEALQGALKNIDRLNDKRSAYRAQWIKAVQVALAQAEGRQA